MNISVKTCRKSIKNFFILFICFTNHGINIIASAPGYESSGHWLEFTVGKLSILPDDLKAIEEEAFADSDMQAVIIPDGCQSIGSGAFRNCEDMSLAIIPASVTSIADDAFENSAYYHESTSSSNDSDSDIFDSWDSSDTDWGSDW